MTARRILVVVALMQLGLGVGICFVTWDHPQFLTYSLMYMIAGLLGLGAALTSKLRIPCFSLSLCLFVIGASWLALGVYSLVLPESTEATNLIRALPQFIVMAAISGANCIAVFRLRDQGKTESI